VRGAALSSHRQWSWEFVLGACRVSVLPSQDRVILSGVEGSLHAQKSLYRPKAFSDLGSRQNSLQHYSDHEQVGIFRLRSRFASRSSYSAQDDSA
jgi:hypothetical protein